MLTAKEAKSWRGVGRVNIAGPRRRGMCTGTLIAPDVVLTAAHCLVDQRTGQMHAPGNTHFVAGWFGGKATGHSKAKAILLHPDYQPGQARSREALGNDIALIRLADPLTGDSAAPFDVAAPPLPGADVTLVSYRRDRQHALSYQDGCPYRSVIGQVLTLDCPVMQGASGAPVFTTTDGKPHVVGVLSAMSTNNQTPKAFVARADLAVADLLGRLP